MVSKALNAQARRKSEPKPKTKTTVEEAGVKVTTLPNGFRIATSHAPHMNKATVGVWTDVGSRYESEDLNGIAHHLEHMIFKGTKNNTAREIAENLEDMGVGPNAYTSRDNTAYFAEGLGEHMSASAKMIADIMLNSTFPDDELVPEKDAIHEEKHGDEEDPEALFEDLEAAGVYGPGHPMGRPILGTHDTIDAISRADLQNFVKTYYTPDNMVLCAAGDVDHDELVAIAEASFGKLKPAAPVTPKPAKLIPGETRERAKTNQAIVSLTFDAPGISTPDRWAWELYATALGTGMASPLFQEVREKRGLVYDITSYYDGQADHGVFRVMAATSPAKAGKMLPVICDVLHSAADTLTERDLKRAKNQLKTAILGAQDSAMHRCEMVADQLFGTGHVKSPEQLQKAIDGVTLADVKRIAKQAIASPMHMTSFGKLGRVPAYKTVLNRIRHGAKPARGRKKTAAPA